MVSPTRTSDAVTLRRIVAEVPDPELPMVTIGDLGIVRDVGVGESGQVVVAITPTYSGCPAIEAIRADVLARLAEHGVDDAEVRVVLSPAWSTDWITPAGREALRRHGIAPPGPAHGLDAGSTASLVLAVRCPQCGSPDTRELSRFGSTACKALWVCRACREPFDHVKAL